MTWMTRMATTGQAFKSGSPSIHHCMSGGGDFRSGGPRMRVKQSFHDRQRRKCARDLCLHPLLPVEVHLLQLCLGGVSGGGPRALRGAGDRGPGAARGRGPRDWARSCRGAWTRCISAGERRRCWLRSCLRGCSPQCARSSISMPDAEITMECAPGQLADTTLEAMAAAGVNRVSLGVQSFVDSEAHASGRLHSRAWSRRICGGCARPGSRT